MEGSFGGRVGEALGELGRASRNGLFDKRSLGVSRWDNVLERYKYSGTQRLPVRLFGRVFKEPFYYVVERLGGEEMMLVRPLLGSSYREGSVFGFFGFSGFKAYKPGQPILLVEGVADLVYVRRHYPFVLACLTAGVSRSQMFFLRNLTGEVWTAFDSDSAGRKGTRDFGRAWGGLHYSIDCPLKDWGEVYEDSRFWGVTSSLFNYFIESRVKYGKCE